MQAAEAKIQKVLEGSKQFLVPHFQRPYSWEKEQWNVLWTDVLELLEDDNPQPHFMGSIVTAPAKSVPEGIEKRLLIDGQQRLTTLLTLLAIVRDLAHEAGRSKLASEIEDLYLTNKYGDGNDYFKLLPTQGEVPAESDRGTFTRIIRGKGDAPKTDGGINAAYKFFYAKIRRADAPDFEALYRAIVGKLTLVSIILDENDNPHRIFESLNGKGRPLTQADLIRNYFFMRIDEREHERTFVELWRPMQKRLGDAALTVFVRHYLMRTGQIVRATDVYATLKGKVDQDRAHGPEDYLKELERFSAYYEVLLRPEGAESKEVRERLVRLNRLDVTVTYPFLLSLYHDFVAERRTEAEVCEVLDVLENFLIRRFVCGVPTHGLNKVFPPLYQQAVAKPDFVEGVKQGLAARGYPRDDDFRGMLGSARLYGAGDRREKTKFVLERLERSYGHKEKVQTENLTIEHVMPQSPNEQWRRDLGPSWEEDHEQLLHTLGNLTLTSYNSELGNDAFASKKKMYATSHVELNRYFVAVETWTAAEIERRADALSDKALSVWPFFGTQAAVPDGADKPGHAKTVTGTVPHLVVVRGKQIPVRSWVEVAQVTLEEIARIGDDEFEQVAAELPKFVNRDSTAFRRSSRLRQLSNGAYFETNVSAAGSHRWCTQAVQIAGLGAEEWRVVWSSSGNGGLPASSGGDGDTGGKTKKPLTATKQLQLDFWTQLRQRLAEAQVVPSLHKPRPQHYFDVAIGAPSAHLALIANVEKGRTEVVLVLRPPVAEELYAALSHDHDTIEAELGAPLVWQASPESDRRRIRLARPSDLRSRETWTDELSWLMDTVVAFKKVFVPRLAAAKAGKTSSRV